MVEYIFRYFLLCKFYIWIVNKIYNLMLPISFMNRWKYFYYNFL